VLAFSFSVASVFDMLFDKRSSHMGSAGESLSASGFCMRSIVRLWRACIFLVSNEGPSKRPSFETFADGAEYSLVEAGVAILGIDALFLGAWSKSSRATVQPSQGPSDGMQEYSAVAEVSLQSTIVCALVTL
jgi:hypothetical protein